MLKYSSYQSIHPRVVQPTKSTRMLFRNKLVHVIGVLILTLLFTGVGLIHSFAADAIAHDQDPDLPLKVSVSTGDTLWSISKQYKPESMDIREFIELIKRVNGKSSSAIQIGEVLQIPILQD